MIKADDQENAIILHFLNWNVLTLSQSELHATIQIFLQSASFFQTLNLTQNKDLWINKDRMQLSLIKPQEYLYKNTHLN